MIVNPPPVSGQGGAWRRGDLSSPGIAGDQLPHSYEGTSPVAYPPRQRCRLHRSVTSRTNSAPGRKSRHCRAAAHRADPRAVCRSARHLSFIVYRRFGSLCHEIVLGSLSWFNTPNSLQRSITQLTCIVATQAKTFPRFSRTACRRYRTDTE